MTDRVSSLTVVLDKAYRVDDIETLMKAMALFPGVIEVVPEVVDNVSEYIAEQRIRRELHEQLFNVIYLKG